MEEPETIEPEYLDIKKEYEIKILIKENIYDYIFISIFMHHIDP